METRKTILYIACSLDGYIAAPNDNLSFLSIVEDGTQDYGYNNFIKTIDTVIMGRKTYSWVMKQVPEFPHQDIETYIITRTPKEKIGLINFYTDNIVQLIRELKSKSGKNIFIDGGAEIVNELLNHHLIDEYIISVIPILLGGGTRLFKDGRPQQQLKLIQSLSFPKGLVQLHYIKS